MLINYSAVTADLHFTAMNALLAVKQSTGATHKTLVVMGAI